MASGSDHQHITKDTEDQSISDQEDEKKKQEKTEAILAAAATLQLASSIKNIQLMSFDDNSPNNNLLQKSTSFENTSDSNPTDLECLAVQETSLGNDQSFQQDSYSTSANVLVCEHGIQSQLSEDVNIGSENFPSQNYVYVTDNIPAKKSKDGVTGAEKPNDNVEDIDKEHTALQNDSHCAMPHSADSTTSSQDVDSTTSHVPSDDDDDTIDSSTNIEDSERYLEKMADCYLSSAARSYLNEKEKNQTKCHRCIAAIICHPYDQEPFVAVLCTGTKYNDGKCYSIQNGAPPCDATPCNASPCDAHAESLCFEAASIFFQNQMSRCANKKNSIFKRTKDKKFALKSTTKFHLLITEPPCGWIQDKQNPCMEWKQSFSEVPHIPTCSARILINSKMGFQGNVSHLLDNCIFLQSVIILCPKDEPNKQTFDFPTAFDGLKLPTISTLEYDQTIFNRRICTFRQMNLGNKPNPSTKSSNESSQNGAKNPSTKSSNKKKSYQNGAKNEKDEGHNTSAIVIQHACQTSFVMNCTYNVHTGTERDHNITQEQRFSIVKRKIDDKLLTEVSKEIQMEQKRKIKVMYDNLIKKLDLEKALQKQLKEREEYKAKKKEEMKKLVAQDTAKQEVEKLLEDNYKCSESWVSKNNENIKVLEKMGPEGKRLIDVQNAIEDIKKLLENPSDCILDCSWKRYFDEPM